MNAPETIAIAAQLLDVTSITPSKTNPRKRFSEQAMDELAASIRQVGVIQPILVRLDGGWQSLRDMEAGSQRYELVTGERRWRAAQRAGLQQIPAIVRELTDVEVVELQCIENLQRQDLDAIEEADGYAMLMDVAHLSVDQIAERVGKSRSYVYARLKLRSLGPDARKALDDGTIDSSKALLLARIENSKLQKAALKKLQAMGEYYSYRETFRRLRDDFFVDLGDAPFALHDAALVPAAGPCTLCPNCSSTDTELAAGEKSAAPICTDKPCFDGKVRAYWTRKRDEYEASGKKVLTGAQAEAIVQEESRSWTRYVGYRPVDEQLYINAEAAVEDEGDQGEPDTDDSGETVTTLGHALEGKGVETVLIELPKSGKLVECVPIAAARQALENAGVKLADHVLREFEDRPRPQPLDPAEEEAVRKRAEAEQARVATEAEVRRRVLIQTFLKFRLPLTQNDLVAFVRYCHTTYEFNQDWDDLFATVKGYSSDSAPVAPVNPGTLTMRDLSAAIALLPVMSEADNPRGDMLFLTDLAKRMKVDIKQIRQALRAEQKKAGEVVADPVDKPAPAKPKKPRAKTATTKKTPAKKAKAKAAKQS